MEKAIYGNGEPGIREQLRIHGECIAKVEVVEKGCKIGELASLLEDIEDRHLAEDQTATEKKTSKLSRSVIWESSGLLWPVWP